MPNRHRVYEQLIKLYPAPYRERYGEQMVQTLTDMLDDQPHILGKAMIWLRTSGDLAVSISKTNLEAMGSYLMNETPTYVKRTTLIGIILLIPFFVVGLSGIMGSQRLASNPFVNAFIGLSLLPLPAIAFIINLVSYLLWFKNKSIQKERSVWQRLFDIRHGWPMLITGSLGLLLCLFVPFHDSAHCVIGNPVRIAHNPRQTWQCVSGGFMGGK